MSGARWARVARAFRRVALPLAAYYAVTLALPLANGAAPSRAFMEHALIVLVVPLIAIILGCAVHTIVHALALGSLWRFVLQICHGGWLCWGCGRRRLVDDEELSQ